MNPGNNDTSGSKQPKTWKQNIARILIVTRRNVKVAISPRVMMMAMALELAGLCVRILGPT